MIRDQSSITLATFMGAYPPDGEATVSSFLADQRAVGSIKLNTDKIENVVGIGDQRIEFASTHGMFNIGEFPVTRNPET